MNLEMWKVKIWEMPLWVHAAFIAFMLIAITGISVKMYNNEKNTGDLTFKDAPGLAVATVLKKVYDNETGKFVIQFGSEDQELIYSQTWLRDQRYVKLHANAKESLYSILSVDDEVVLAYVRRGHPPTRVWIVKKE